MIYISIIVLQNIAIFVSSTLYNKNDEIDI